MRIVPARIRASAWPSPSAGLARAARSIEREACLGSLRICDLGLACMDGTCLAGPGEGEACHLTGGNPCGAGLQCNFETSVCERLPTGGEACTFSCADGFDCEGDRCVAQEPVICGVDLYDDGQGG